MQKLPDTLTEFLLPSADEGELHLIYGRIGSGKTYCATAMQLEALQRGQIVYSSYPINFDGFDDRTDSVTLFFNMLFPWRDLHYVFPKENWRYFDPFADDVWEQLGKMNNCTIFLDDCIVDLFDSYEMAKFAKFKRKWAFFTRHYNRTIVLVTQRPNQVQVALRSQVNRFFKCTKMLSSPFNVFRMEEYQDMIAENVDDSGDPVSRRTFWGKKRIYQAYDTKYLFAGDKMIPAFEVWRLSLVERFFAFVKLIGLKSKKFYSREAAREKLSVKKLDVISETVGAKVRITSIKKPVRAQYGTGSVAEQDKLPF